MIYLDKQDYQPLQIVLRDLLTMSQVSSSLYEMAEDQNMLTEMLKAAEQMKYGVIVMTLPILILYLIMQQYFVQGITMGSVKG